MPRVCRPTFVLPGKWRGLKIRGNIDICSRPRVFSKKDRSYATVLSASKTVPGTGEVLYPCVLLNPPRIVNRDQGFAEYERTGKHLGIFTDWHASDRYAEALHLQQERIYKT